MANNYWVYSPWENLYGLIIPCDLCHLRSTEVRANFFFKLRGFYYNMLCTLFLYFVPKYELTFGRVG